LKEFVFKVYCIEMKVSGFGGVVKGGGDGDIRCYEAKNIPNNNLLLAG
jgi:hypothetical protein